MSYKVSYVVMCIWITNTQIGDENSCLVGSVENTSSEKYELNGRLLWIRAVTWGHLEGMLLVFYETKDIRKYYFTTEDIMAIYG